MFNGYFTLGGNEVGNNARALGYTRTSNCPTHWLRETKDLGGLVEALGDEPYTYDRIIQAPWYDSDDPEVTSRFLGLYIVSISGLSDSTRTASITEKNSDGAQVSGYRRASREVRVRAMLTAQGMDALEAGMTWLRNVLEPGACGMHEGVDCGASDFSFFVDAPPKRVEGETEVDYNARVATLRRYLHTVTTVSGPLIQESYTSSDKLHVGYLVEFTVIAATPAVYGVTKEIVLSPTTPSVLQDTPFNLVVTPSAVLTTGTIIGSRNYSPNPSVEVNGTDWVGVTEVVSGSNPSTYYTSGRITGELAAVGLASFRGRILGNGSTAASGRAYIWTRQTVPLTGLPNGTRVSFNIWAAIAILAGASGSTIHGVQVTAVWRTSTTVLSTITIGNATAGDYGGLAYQLDSQLKPNAADNVLVQVRFDVTWASSATPANNSDIRAYVDALAVTVP